MTETKDGGAAFPRGAIGEDCGRPYGTQRGMTLRDWFAGQALPAIISATSAGAHHPGASNEEIAGRPIEDRMAFDAYRIADAMIAEREKAQ